MPGTEVDASIVEVSAFGQLHRMTLDVAVTKLRELDTDERAANTDRLRRAIALGHFLINFKAALRACHGYGCYERVLTEAGLRLATARQRVQLAVMLSDHRGAFDETKYRELERRHIDRLKLEGATAADSRHRRIGGDGEENRDDSMPEPYLMRALRICGLERERASRTMPPAFGRRPEPAKTTDDDDAFNVDDVEAGLDAMHQRVAGASQQRQADDQTIGESQRSLVASGPLQVSPKRATADSSTSMRASVASANPGAAQTGGGGSMGSVAAALGDADHAETSGPISTWFGGHMRAQPATGGLVSDAELDQIHGRIKAAFGPIVGSPLRMIEPDVIVHSEREASVQLGNVERARQAVPLTGGQMGLEVVYRRAEQTRQRMAALSAAVASRSLSGEQMDAVEAAFAAVERAHRLVCGAGGGA